MRPVAGAVLAVVLPLGCCISFFLFENNVIQIDIDNAARAFPIRLGRLAAEERRAVGVENVRAKLISGTRCENTWTNDELKKKTTENDILRHSK